MKLFVITGTCGAGKSTMKDYLSKNLTNKLYVPVDVDEVHWDKTMIRCKR